MLQLTGRTVRTKRCGDCGGTYDHVTGFVSSGDRSVAAYFASCHGHPEHQAGIDAVLGTWGQDDVSDHVMFSCLLRAEGAMAVDASVALEQEAIEPILGRRLRRDEALAHPWATTFWEVIDAIAAGDPDVAAAIRGVGDRPV